jgi:hypothetical protein
MPAVRRILADGLAEGRAKRVFDLGCGNGATAQILPPKGGRLPALIPRKRASPTPTLAGSTCVVGSAYDDLAAEFGCFPFVL